MELLDLDNLTNLPWFVGQCIPEMCHCPEQSRYDGACRNLHNSDGVDVTHPCAGLCPADAELLARLSQMFEIMMRREWQPLPLRSITSGKVGGWIVSCFSHQPEHTWLGRWADSLADKFPADPATAMIEAERWYVENVEKKGVDGGA